MEYYRIPLYILFGILPSLSWLFYYLKKDLHPEPKRMILKVFIMGCLSTIPTFFIQTGLITLLRQYSGLPVFTAYPILLSLLTWFLIIALTEELFKYLAVRLSVFGSYTLDEPLDIMLYMVVSALGFAAVENMLYLFSPIGQMSFGTTFETAIVISGIRFMGATFLHTLSSGLIGYFIALSLSVAKNSKKVFVLPFFGFIIAILLHGLYNFSIITLDSPYNIIIPVSILLGLVIFMLYDFDHIKKVKSICKL